MATKKDSVVNSLNQIWSEDSSTVSKVDAASSTLATSGLSSADKKKALQESNVPVKEEQSIIQQADVKLQSIDRNRNKVTMKVYSTFTEDDVVDSISRRVTAGLWTGNTGSLSSFYTSSNQSASSGDWYYDIYNANPDVSSSAEVQFSITFGDRTGCNYPRIADLNTSKEPTRATYAQYRNLLLDPEDEKFTFGNSWDSDQIFVINIQRARLKQKMDVGNWQLDLATGSAHIKLIDDSSDKFDQSVSQAGRVYNVVSGTLNVGSTSTIKTTAANEPSGGLGLFYPDRGLIILNPYAIQEALKATNGQVETFATHSSSATTTIYDSKYDFFEMIVNGGTVGNGFQARNEEVVTSTHYFVRAKNRDYNLSNNPTYYTSSDGSLKVSSFVGDPKTYITTIGLYNNSNELLAVAKLSQPILKSFDREALIKIKLDF